MEPVKSHKKFLELLGSYYHVSGRYDLPWRLPESDGSFDPYKILVSEIMLQQTQVPRVIPKFEQFLQRFPTLGALANASLGDVLTAWQGLGYNRRAKFLRQAAQRVVHDYCGTLPRDQLMLKKLPGIGRNTAGAIMAYAFNEPVLFIETNIRTVYIYHFFHDQIDISDRAILRLLHQTLDQDDPRIFYWSLMDYGAYLKATIGNLSRASKMYVKQSQFDGSLRQIRGRVLKILTEGPKTEVVLLQSLDDERSEEVLKSLIQEGLVQKTANRYRLP